MREIIGNTTTTPNPRPNWAQEDKTKPDYIKNKPTSLSQFENDSDFITKTEAQGYTDEKFAEIEGIAKGANQAISFDNYEAMIVALNGSSNNYYSVGQNVMIITLNVPDLWISSVEENDVNYTYISDEDFTNALKTNGFIQVGYFKLSALETQKVDLTNYVEKVDGKGLSTNDFDNDYKAKVDSALQSYTETDPTVPAWAKEETKPSYTYSEIINKPTIPTKTSELTNDSGYKTEQEVITIVNNAIGDLETITAQLAATASYI